MKQRFSIEYNTAWGESMHVVLTYRSGDGAVKRNNIQMSTADGQYWTAETVVRESRQHPIETVEYYYRVEDADGKVLRREWTAVKRTYHFDVSKDYIFADRWNDMPLPHHLYSNACCVTRGLKPDEEVRPLRLPLFRRTLLFRISAPQLKPGQSVAVCGSHPALGCWNATRFQRMHYAEQMEWMLSVDIMSIPLPVEYKYVVIDDKTNNVAAWEEGDNRLVTVCRKADGNDRRDELLDGEVLVLDGGVIRVAEDPWKVAGVAVPVFSLRSGNSCGVGDFADLRLLVDWANSVGMKIIQLLPVNDTTDSHRWPDSYPYNVVSVFALHPHYISLETAGILKDKEAMKTYSRRKSELNALRYSDYEAVDRVKMEYLVQLYKEQGESVMATAEAKDFVVGNAYWIDNYAGYCAERDSALGCGQEKEFYVYVQYLLHVQLKSAADYAREHGVVLKGDLPIGVSRNGADAMTMAHYFNLDSQAGAPPDAFSHDGQNWGFPTYNWQAMDADGYQWWHRRLHHLEQYFDALRIDHVLGFFRIWEIPCTQKSGVLGHFSPSLPLTPGEIEYFGVPWRKDLLTKPFINDTIIERLFGIHAGYVKENFLVAKSYNLYDLQPQYDTQRKIEHAFEGKNDENSIWIRDGLCRLISNVLFVPDPYREDMYHPCIGALHSQVFRMLGDDERESYMRLYNNYFYQRHSMYWGNVATGRLQAVFGGCRMLCCAEDLGMLPDSVAPVLDANRMLTLEIQTMPKMHGYEFAHLDSYPYRSVCTISTHDMPSLRLWWQENRDVVQRYYVTMLQREGYAPEQLPAHIAEEIVARHLYCPSMMCVLSLQDWLSMDGELRGRDVKSERINRPDDPYNRWQYRMPITIEQLANAGKYNEKLRTMIVRSKR